MCGRLSRKIEQLSERHWNLLGLGQQDLADVVEKEQERYEQLLGIADSRRDNPEIDPA